MPNENQQQTIFFAGSSGRYYPFRLYLLDADLPNSAADLPNSAAVYIYIQVAFEDYTPLYIGETASLETRFDDLLTWRCVNVHYANAIGVLFEHNADARRDIKRDLIEKHQPICNDLRNK